MTKLSIHSSSCWFCVWLVCLYYTTALFYFNERVFSTTIYFIVYTIRLFVYSQPLFWLNSTQIMARCVNATSPCLFALTDRHPLNTGLNIFIVFTWLFLILSCCPWINYGSSILPFCCYVFVFKNMWWTERGNWVYISPQSCYLIWIDIFVHDVFILLLDVRNSYICDIERISNLS